MVRRGHNRKTENHWGDLSQKATRSTFPVLYALGASQNNVCSLDQARSGHSDLYSVSELEVYSNKLSTRLAVSLSFSPSLLVLGKQVTLSLPSLPVLGKQVINISLVHQMFIWYLRNSKNYIRHLE